MSAVLELTFWWIRLTDKLDDFGECQVPWRKEDSRIENDQWDRRGAPSDKVVKGGLSFQESDSWAET